MKTEPITVDIGKELMLNLGCILAESVIKYRVKSYAPKMLKQFAGIWVDERYLLLILQYEKGSRYDENSI